jgi:hypothetical protein
MDGARSQDPRSEPLPAEKRIHEKILARSSRSINYISDNTTASSLPARRPFCQSSGLAVIRPRKFVRLQNSCLLHKITGLLLYIWYLGTQDHKTLLNLLGPIGVPVPPADNKPFTVVKKRDWADIHPTRKVIISRPALHLATSLAHKQRETLGG